MAEVLATSLRARPPSETLVRARALGRAMGVVRVTDTTPLDRCGVPVFASIRPDAMPGSVCVSAGKGMRRDEAEIGAYMEAIELAFAEPGRGAVAIERGTVRDVLDTRDRGIDALLDLCPSAGAAIDLDRPLDCVVAHDIFTGAQVRVPAELVLLPVERSYFGSDSNGLASGNTLLEATVHGLCEVIERDIHAHLLGRDLSVPVALDSLPPEVRALADRAAGIELVVRYVPGPFGLPFFLAALREHGIVDGVHLGMGCHPWRALALARAVTEAFQSRLSLIHGGRDDLLAHLAKFAPLSAGDRMRRFHLVVDGYAARDEAPIAFADIVDRSADAQTLEASLDLLAREVRSVGLERFYRVVLTPEDCPLVVVRVLVPGLEVPRNDREGRRVRQWRAGAHLVRSA